MDRRRSLFLALLVLPVSLRASVQPAGKKARVGAVHWSVPASRVAKGWPTLAARLRDLGWTEGQNLELLVRSADLKRASLSAIVDELVRARVDVIVAAGNIAALEVKGKAPAMPIVLRDGFMPVEAGLAADIKRPGGNVTGVVGYAGIEVDGKKLALLKEAAPSVTRVAYLSDDDQLQYDRLDPKGLSPDLIPNSTVEASRALGISLSRWVVNRPEELERAFATLKAQRINGLFVDTPLHDRRIVELARLNRLPAVYSYDKSVQAGGLMSYTWASDEALVAAFVDKILRGAKAGDLPMEFSKEYEFHLNLRAARDIGLDIPQSVRIQAVRVTQ